MLSRIRRSMADKDEGFTLIELLVVIIIIGILAVIAIPVFLNQRKKAVDASLKSDLHNAAVIVEAWAVDNPGAAVAPPGGWETAVAPQANGPVMNGLKLSPGTRIGLHPSATRGIFIMSSDLNPDVVPVKWARALLTLIPVRDIDKETAVVNMFPRYEGPAALAEPQ